MFKHMLIPSDGSAAASSALQRAVALAGEMHAKVTVLVVTEPFHVLSAEVVQVERVREDFDRYTREQAERHLQWAQELAQAQGVACDAAQVKHEQPYEAIIDAARDRGCDLIAMGSHGYGAMKAAILGSVTQKVLTHCRTPVLVYR